MICSSRKIMSKLEREARGSEEKLIFSLTLGPEHDSTLLPEGCAVSHYIPSPKLELAEKIHDNYVIIHCDPELNLHQRWTKENITETKLIATPREIRGIGNELKRLSRVLAYSIQSGGIHDLVNELEQRVDSDFLRFKEDLKQHAMDETQFSIANSLNEIEERTTQFPLFSPKQAAVLLGDVTSKNPSRTINKAKEDGELFVFYFGNTKTAQVPSFQFNTRTLGVWKIIPKLAKTLKGLNDWGVYSWFTTDSDDLGCTPAEAVSKPEAYDDLTYLAGLFKSESTLRDLNFVAHSEVD